MNAGARVAQGDLFLFVHADTIVPPAFDEVLRNAFLDPTVLMTTFSFGINRALLRGKEPFGMAVMERITNYRTRSVHLPYGDQASTAPQISPILGFVAYCRCRIQNGGEFRTEGKNEFVACALSGGEGGAGR